MTQNRYNNELEEKILRFREEARITRNHYLRQMYKTEEDALEATKQRFIQDERNIYPLDWLLREVEIIMLANLPHEMPRVRTKPNFFLLAVINILNCFLSFWGFWISIIVALFLIRYLVS